MKPLTKTLSILNESPTLTITANAKALKASGADVVMFSSGEPDFDAPSTIAQAAKNTIDKGGNGYTAAAGLSELRDAVKSRFNRFNALEYDAADITVSSGAKQALFNAVRAVCDPGDEVIVIAPYWVSYPEMCKLAGATPIVVRAQKSDGFVPREAALEAAFNEKTKAIIINTPNNPTGALYTEETLRMIGRLSERHDVLIISDEIYDTLVYDTKHIPMASLAQYAARTLTINGMSKAYAMTGWRIGFAAGPRALIQAMNKIQSHTTSNANTIAQHASIAGLEACDEDVRAMRNTFQKRRDKAYASLSALEGVEPFFPKGAFYVLCDISALLGTRYGETRIDSAQAFAEALLKAKHVALVPGEAFDAPKSVRVSYATDEQSIDKGLSRLRDFISELSH